MLERFGSPTINELYTVNTFSAGVELRALLAFTIGLILGVVAAHTAGWSGLTAVAAGIGGALLTVIASAPVIGYFILSRLERSHGRDMPRKVVEWFRTAQDGDRLDLDRL